jgi:hypothetical protein
MLILLWSQTEGLFHKTLGGKMKLIEISGEEVRTKSWAELKQKIKEDLEEWKMDAMKLGNPPELARKGKYTLEQALKKVYIVKNKNTIGVIHVPSVLLGKRVKLVIEDDTETKAT